MILGGEERYNFQPSRGKEIKLKKIINSKKDQKNKQTKKTNKGRNRKTEVDKIKLKYIHIHLKYKKTKRFSKKTKEKFVKPS